MYWGLWILLPEATEGAVDAIHRSTRIETEHYKVKRLTGAIAIGSSMPVCDNISVGDSLVIPMCHSMCGEAIVSPGPKRSGVYLCFEVLQEDWLPLITPKGK